MPPDGPTGASGPTAPGAGSGHRVLAGIALVLTCIALVIATSALWVHQVALNTDRFTALVTDVAAEQAFVQPIASRVSEKVVTAIDLETRIADQLPGPSKRLAPAMAVAVQGVIERQLQNVLSNPRVRAGVLDSITFTHRNLVRFLRGDTSAVTISDGYVQMDVFPIIGAALTQVQALGLIPPEVQLPDLSTDEAPAAIKGRLEAALGITLPADFGTVRLMEAQRLATAQTVVQAFDIVVVVLVLLTVVLAALTVWLARDRRRMAVYLAIGIVIALLIARFVVQSISSSVVDGIEDAGLQVAIRTVVQTTVDDLIRVTTIVLIAAIVLGIAAYLSGRPAWLTRLTSRSAG